MPTNRTTTFRFKPNNLARTPTTTYYHNCLPFAPIP